MLVFMETNLFCWIITAIIIANFYQDLRKGCIKLSLPLSPKVALIALLLAFAALFVLTIKLVAANQNNFILFILIAFLIIFSLYEKVRKNYHPKFSSAFVFFKFALILNLTASYLVSIANAYNWQNISKTSHLLSDNIIGYSRANLKSESDQISIWTYFISESLLPIIYLGKENNNINSSVGFLYSNIGLRFFELQRDDNNKGSGFFTMNYLFDNVKKQVRSKSMKIIFVDRGDLCKISFLENYFYDPEFKKIFLENYHFDGRIFLSQEVKNNKPVTDLPSYKTVYDFEIYVRNNAE